MKKSIGSKKAVVGLCSVLVAVSAFFYAPIDAEASSSNTVSGSVSPNVFNIKNAVGHIETEFINIDNIDSNTYYKVSLNPIFTLSFPSEIGYAHVRQVTYSLGNNFRAIQYFNGIYPEDSLVKTDYRNFEFVIKGNYLKDNKFFVDFRFDIGNNVPFSYDYELIFNLNSCVPLDGEQSASYQQGYNVGYSVGEQAGQDIGYSNGYEVGFEQGENQGYESGFEAGKDSVDTDSYYDMGYSAGYDAGYLSGYDEGYDEGYDAGYEQAVSNLTKYGADANTYPIHLGTVSASNTYTTILPFYNDPRDLIFIPYEFDISSYDINPNYNYRVMGMIEQFCFGGQWFNYDYAEIFLQAGSKNYFIGTMVNGYDFKYSYGFKAFISGADMSSKLSIKVIAHGAYGEVEKEEYRYPYMNLITSACTLTVSNLGASSTETNQIANSTDVLENTLEEQKEIQKEQAETQKGIAQSIKDFFGSFFDNLINSIIHVIVPTKEEMGELFNRLNDFFSETFGFLYYPFEFIINAFNIFLVADSGTGLTLPAFSIMGYEVWGSQTYDIASEPIVGEIFGFVRMGTGAMLVMWFVNFLKDFFDKRFGGGGS